MDDCEKTEHGADGTLHLHNLTDLHSRYRLPPLAAARLPCGEEVAGHLQYLFDRFDPPLFCKRDNGGNLNYLAVNQVLEEALVIPINNPPYRAPYNEGIEHTQGEFKSYLAINCHLASIRGFFDYLYDEGQLRIVNPVKKGCGVRVSHPLPRYLKDEQLDKLFALIRCPRDRAMFMLMLRCGLRVEEVARLTIDAVDLRHHRIRVESGKSSKDRIVYISNDAQEELSRYLRTRSVVRSRSVFVVEKGPCRGKPLSVRGIQKRMEYYARKSGLTLSCHHLRHNATQMHNADAPLVSIQDLLGHNLIMTTQRYCKVSNLKVQRDHQAMERIVSRYQEQETS